MVILIPLISWFLAVTASDVEEGCCLEKLVGGVRYNFLEADPEATEPPYSCQTQCVYSTEEGGRFCFRVGELFSKCMDVASAAIKEDFKIGCPVKKVTAGDPCPAEGLECGYDMVYCCGSSFPSFTGICNGGSWGIITPLVAPCSLGCEEIKPECPESPPENGSPCSEVIKCGYKQVDCCGMEMYTIGSVCMDGSWKTEDLRNPCSSPDYKCPEKCPLEKPSNGEPCSSEGQTCEYDPYYCCGDEYFSYKGQCSGGEWNIKKEEPGCFYIPEMPCPDKECPPADKVPKIGTYCSRDGMTCGYDPVDCCGEAISTFVANCSGNVWEGEWMKPECLTDPDFKCPDCPDETPVAGDVCDTKGLRCNYGSHSCCGKPPFPTIFSTCSGTNWEVAYAKPAPCPVECGDPTCPPDDERPEAGSSCSSDKLTCHYSYDKCCGELVPTYIGTCNVDTWEVVIVESACMNPDHVCPTCPPEAPEPDSACSVTGLECNYGNYSCCGSKPMPTTYSTCDGSQWRVAEMMPAPCAPDCGESPTKPAPSSCPLTKPESEESCPEDGVKCEYDPFYCCGAIAGYTYFSSCESGSWLIAMAEPICSEDCGGTPSLTPPVTPSPLPKDCPSPDSLPGFGESCKNEGLTCNYGYYYCCGELQGPTYMSTCESGTWIIAMSSMVKCPCPVTTPPKLP